MRVYYNEIDKNAVAMLRQLMKDGIIADGEIDNRSIAEVEPKDVKGFTQCHFFAGIGGWQQALRGAGWADNQPVWTGSCPCQPFSRGGKQKAQSDDRHLWPIWNRLIKECRPTIVFGEQVEAAITHGWLDEVANDMEGQGYAFGSAVLSSFAAESPDNRERIFFVGNAKYDGRDSTQAVGGVTTSIFSGKEGKKITVELERASSSRMLPYSDIQWRKYPHGLARAIKPGIRLLANGIPSRSAEIHALGNAINLEVTIKFIQACM